MILRKGFYDENNHDELKIKSSDEIHWKVKDKASSFFLLLPLQTLHQLRSKSPVEATVDLRSTGGKEIPQSHTKERDPRTKSEGEKGK